MEPLGPAEPVQDELKPATEPMEEVQPAEEQKEEPSTLPLLAEPQIDGNAAAAAAAAEDLQDTTLEPAAAPATNAAGQGEAATGNDAARAETPIPIATSTTTTPVPTTPATPAGKPRPILQGTLIGLFVAIDPATQRGKVNVKRELEFMGIHQRDLAPKEEVQLSLEQAFYLVAGLKHLEVYLPAPPPPSPFQHQQVEQEEGQEGHAMDQGNGESEREQQESQQQEEAVAIRPQEDAESKALSVVECWKAFRTASSTFVKSVGSYRYFREQGFVVHGGLNLGLDFMLYRGTPQRYHAEFGVLLRYPPSFPPSMSSSSEGGGEGGGEGGEEGGRDENGLSWRDLHLLYRLIGEVRKTLILGHVRLGKLEEEDKIEVNEKGREEEEEGVEEVRREMQQWYSGLSVYEVAITPWRGGTPLARLKMAKQKGTAAQVKKGGGQAGGKKRGRRGGGGGEGEGGRGGGRGSGAEEEEHPSKRQHI